MRSSKAERHTTRAWAAAAIVFLATASPGFASPTADVFFDVVKNGTAEDVQREIAGGADVNAADEDGWTPLMAAAGYNARPEVIQLLLKAGADVNAWDSMSMTALNWAAMLSSNPEVIKIILEAGADAESRDVGGDTPMMFAARYNPSPAVLAALLAGHPELEARDHTEETALLLAARYNNVAVVTQLLDSGADPKAQDNLSLTAFDWAKNNAKLRGSHVLIRLKDSSGSRRPAGLREGIRTSATEAAAVACDHE